MAGPDNRPGRPKNQKMEKKKMSDALANVVASIISGGMILTAITLLSGLIVGISCWLFSIKM